MNPCVFCVFDVRWLGMAWGDRRAEGNLKAKDVLLSQIGSSEKESEVLCWAVGADCALACHSRVLRAGGLANAGEHVPLHGWNDHRTNP